MRVDTFELGGLTTGGTILTAERLVAVFTVAHVCLVVRKGMDLLPQVAGISWKRFMPLRPVA